MSSSVVERDADYRWYLRRSVTNRRLDATDGFASPLSATTTDSADAKDVLCDVVGVSLLARLSLMFYRRTRS